jgi:Tfp pilus assembly protein PilO
MKELVSKLSANLHVFIFLYALYGVYLGWDEHSIKMDELEAQFPVVQAEIETNNKKVSEIQEFVKKTEESKVRVEEVSKNIEAVQRQLPSDINDNQILTFFNQEMTVLNIKDPNVVPGVEKPSTFTISKDYAVKAKGTFLQLIIFFERIGNAARIYNVKSLKMTTSGVAQRGRFQIINGESVIEAFRYNPAFKVEREAEK